MGKSMRIYLESKEGQDVNKDRFVDKEISMHFYKSYVISMALILQLTRSQTHLLLMALNIMDYQNCFPGGKAMHSKYNELASKVKVKKIEYSTVRQNLVVLSKMNIIRRKPGVPGWYIVNEELFFKGSELDRKVGIELTVRFYDNKVKFLPKTLDKKPQDGVNGGLVRDLNEALLDVAMGKSSQDES